MWNHIYKCNVAFQQGMKTFCVNLFFYLIFGNIFIFIAKLIKIDMTQPFCVEHHINVHPNALVVFVRTNIRNFFLTLIFASSKHSNIENEQSFVFFKHPFFYHSFWKLKRILTLMIRKAEGLKSMKNILITHLSTFGLKVFLTLKVMNFENVILIFKNHIYMIKGTNA